MKLRQTGRKGLVSTEWTRKKPNTERRDEEIYLLIRNKVPTSNFC